MALSSILRNSLVKGTGIKSLTNQILRSSSICVKSSNSRPTPMSNFLDTSAYKPKFIAPSVGSSQILAKYLSSTAPRLSADGKVHDHVGIWKIERVLSIALLPLVPAALIAPSPALDTLVAVVIVMHTHWGLEAIVVDYIRPILFGEIGPKIGMALLYAFSAITLAGCLNLIYNDIGLANAFIELWKL